ncbi:sigma-54-dependent transcriptional regulator [Sphingobacterium hungaricum]|uniref:Sigma-54-dependent Fis family transcriptional regulator n=1 Tax=Sphingobacterium hungaricum TaxID=2082723 RepID=A0A928UYU9_9SPHI|nr:sigma-54 dependent transcriptional regulator [Sphingobacterium hungaricum]MBE8715553.1 sigma-54-dependent Fis family transcriptional regulator [Sphingobacterium hungaricum]
MKKATVLVVDDDQDVLTALRILLKPKFKLVLTEPNPERIVSILERQHVDVLLLDMNFKSSLHTGNEGIFWLSKIKEKFPDIQVVMITAYGSVDLAVKSLKQGASDFIVKPFQNEHMVETIETVLQETKSATKSQPKQLFSEAEQAGIIGKSAIMQDLFHKIEKIAPTDANILILGENGTGKDLIAHAIHEKSLRKQQAFVKVDVGSLTETLFESELFGHKKGAFTDAREDRNGRFVSAEKGTLFLDEIGNISLQQQAKLLSVLQNRKIIPLGSNEQIPIDIRLLCATNLPVQMLANENKFRKDLIYRINTVEIFVPPLRERGEDIGLLSTYFLDFYAKKYNKNKSGFDADAIRKLNSYHFPGNVRELQYSIERAVIMSDNEFLQADDILFSPIEMPSENAKSESNSSLNLEEIERKAIQTVVDRCNGNISKAAKELGLTRAALYRRLEKYNI